MLMEIKLVDGRIGVINPMLIACAKPTSDAKGSIRTTKRQSRRSMLKRIRVADNAMIAGTRLLNIVVIHLWDGNSS